MAFSVSMSRPFRSLGLYRSNGKHAAPKGSVPASRAASDGSDGAKGQATLEPAGGHQPAHAATSPRLTSPGAATRRPEHKTADVEKTAA